MHAPDFVTGIGLVAGSLTTAALIPQAHRMWKTKSARDVSLAMAVSMSIGIVLWIVYGVLRGELAIILANAVALLISSTILVLKLRHG